MREAELLREALVNATMSLETISRNAGKSEALLDDFMSVRGYANSRATIAREALAAKHEVSTDPLNALERDNADLNAELTETIAAVSDLMDENKRFRDVLEMDDGENPETLRQELMELAEVTIRIREENADLRLKLAEFTAVRAVNKPFIPPQEATDEP